MMVLPLYKDHRADFESPKGGHAGLWYTRFFDGFARTAATETSHGWEVSKDKKEPWISRTGNRCGDKTALDKACFRQLDRTQALEGQSRVFSTCWNFVTGLGLPHPVENGFTWHPTLGVPYLCGAAVKGLIRAWVEEVAELAEEVRDARLVDWFGTQDGAGKLIFFDAMPCEPPSLEADVMTPHQDKWYLEGAAIEDAGREPAKVPADWHDPRPVPFLAVNNGKFLFSLAPRSPEWADLVQPAFDALERALDELGAGAKTAVGYGQMKKDAATWREIQDRKSLHDLEVRKVLEAQAKAAKIQPMSPLDRAVAEHLAEHPDEPSHIILLRALEHGKWVGDEARHVAQEIRKLMRAAGVWRLSYQGKNKGKKKNYDRSQKVLGFLGESEHEPLRKEDERC